MGLLHLLQGKQRGFWGTGPALVLAVALRLAAVLLVEASGNTALDRPAPTFCPAGGKPRHILPRNQCIGTERSAERSGASRACLVRGQGEAPKVSTACGTGPRDQPITPPHLETHVFTFCYFLMGFSCMDSNGPIKDPHLTNLQQ